MKLVKVKKEFKPNVGPEEMPKQKENLFGDSLDMLNNLNNDSHYDFGSDKVSVNDRDVIKLEEPIVKCCINTFTKSFLKVGIVCLICYLLLKVFNVDFKIFLVQDYSKEIFYSELRKLFIIVSIILLLVCILIKISINGSIKSVFKRKYLNKVNVYIYDVFSVILNIIMYSVTSSVCFYYLNMYYDRLEKWQEIGRLVKNANIEIINWFKYAVVIVVAIFIAVNSLKSISIIHSRNEFRLEDEI